jgi:phosphatidylinositol-3-phosphatase
VINSSRREPARIGSAGGIPGSTATARPGYQLRTIPLTGVAGAAATITFTGSENNSLATGFVIDDTALDVS